MRLYLGTLQTVPLRIMSGVVFASSGMLCEPFRDPCLSGASWNATRTTATTYDYAYTCGVASTMHDVRIFFLQRSQSRWRRRACEKCSDTCVCEGCKLTARVEVDYAEDYWACSGEPDSQNMDPVDKARPETG